MAPKKKYTAEFKEKVAREAQDKSGDDLYKVAKANDVPLSVVTTWVSRLEKDGPGSFSDEVAEGYGTEDEAIADGAQVQVEISNEDIAESVSYGVMKDHLNYKRLIFWSLMGIVLFVVFIQALTEMHKVNTLESREHVASGSQFYKVNQQKQQAQKQLGSFGVVDPENGIYRIPIDSAINELAVDGK